jgi:hypothetical protein
MATFRNIAVSLLYHAGVTEITRTLQAIGRDRTHMLSYLRNETGITNDFADPVAFRDVQVAGVFDSRDDGGADGGQVGGPWPGHC